MEARPRKTCGAAAGPQAAAALACGTLANVEADLFLAAYAMRKLIEAKKVSDETELLRIAARAHPLVKGPVDHRNWHKIDELFDLQRSRAVEVGLLAFCNQVIHSFTFIAATDEDGHRV